VSKDLVVYGQGSPEALSSEAIFSGCFYLLRSGFLFIVVIAPAEIEFSYGSSADFNATFFDVCWDPIRGILFKRILSALGIIHPLTDKHRDCTFSLRWLGFVRLLGDGNTI
jgi:hypothetical protein